MVWPFKRKQKPTVEVSVSHYPTYRTGSTLQDRSPVLDKHFRLLEKLQNTYTPSSEQAVEKSIKICHELIGISAEVKSTWLRMYGTSRGPGKTPGLPSHPGYRQLAIILEKRHEFEEAITVAKKAQGQGWTGDWEKRIARCEAKIAKRAAQA